MKYKKKPVEIEAVQFIGFDFETGEPSFDEETVWLKCSRENGTILHYPESIELIVKTLEGQHIASIGDFIIRGVQGELYPCKPDIFAMTYIAI